MLRYSLLALPLALAAAPGLARDVEIRGALVDQAGKPVPGAKVTAYAFVATPTATSAADGTFSLAVPASRTPSLQLTAMTGDRRLAAYYRIDDEFEPTAPQVAVQLVAKPPRQFKVEVTDAAGKPLAGIHAAAAVWHNEVGKSQTDEAGMAVLFVPADAPVRAVFAYKRGVGLDYTLFIDPRRSYEEGNTLKVDESQPIKLAMNGHLTAKVQVVDEKGRPLRGAQVQPWYFRKPGKPGILNVVIDDFRCPVDEHGLATFDGIPADNLDGVVFWSRLEGFFQAARATYQPEHPDKELTTTMVKLVTVRGRAVQTAGAPAAGAEIQARGEGYAEDSFNTRVWADADGRFELELAPEQLYLIVARTKDWASRARNLVVQSAAPKDTLEFRLQPAARVHGRLIDGATKAPISNGYVGFTLRSPVQHENLPQGEQLANPRGSRKTVSPRIGRGVRTQADGGFELLLGPGEYYWLEPGGAPAVHLEIDDQRDVELSLESHRPEKGMLKGRVVLAGDTLPGPASVEVKSRSIGSHPTFEISTKIGPGADGRFEVERLRVGMLLVAGTSDSHLLGAAQVSAEDNEATITIGPTVRVTGRLFDEESGRPAANKRLQFGLEIKNDDRTSTTFLGQLYGGHAATDDHGAFVLEHLIPGWDYAISAAVKTDERGEPVDWKRFAVFKPDKAGSDLGERKLAAPNRPPSIADRLKRHLAAGLQTADERLRGKLRDAKLGYQRVLVVLGRAECEPMKRLFSLYYGDETGELMGAFANYSIFALEPNEAATKLVAKLGIQAASGSELNVAVLDESGALVAVTDERALRLADRSELDRLRSFLKEHAPKLPDGEELLRAGLERAKRENKLVLVQHSGAYCGPCVLLSRYVDSHQALIDKAFVYVKLDNRLTNGSKAIERVRKNPNGGIPWMVILDADGKELITGNGKEGNIGYPAEPEGREHFERMLRVAGDRLTDAEIQQLLEPLGKGT